MEVPVIEDAVFRNLIPIRQIYTQVLRISEVEAAVDCVAIPSDTTRCRMTVCSLYELYTTERVTNSMIPYFHYLGGGSRCRLCRDTELDDPLQNDCVEAAADCVAIPSETTRCRMTVCSLYELYTIGRVTNSMKLYLHYLGGGSRGGLCRDIERDDPLQNDCVQCIRALHNCKSHELYETVPSFLGGGSRGGLCRDTERDDPLQNDCVQCIRALHNCKSHELYDTVPSLFRRWKPRQTVSRYRAIRPAAE
ncbi:hypothetical protein J6590_001937 [Homalodisca vitripennis]|nr:hypothetical protein J6590_001937 [Homalodisca vitripennis]